MHIEYGPPAARGVGHIQYLSGDEAMKAAPSTVTQLVRPAGIVAAVVWGYAEYTKEKSMAKAAKYMSLALFAVDLFYSLRSR